MLLRATVVRLLNFLHTERTEPVKAGYVFLKQSYCWSPKEKHPVQSSWAIKEAKLMKDHILSWHPPGYFPLPEGVFFLLPTPPVK